MVMNVCNISDFLCEVKNQKIVRGKNYHVIIKHWKTSYIFSENYALKKKVFSRKNILPETNGKFYFWFCFPSFDEVIGLLLHACFQPSLP